MAAPTKITQGVYYVPPPQSGGNIAAAALSGYLKQRTKYANEAMAKRLEDMTLLDRGKEIDGIVAKQTAMLNEARRVRQEAMMHSQQGMQFDINATQLHNDGRQIALNESKTNAELAQQREIALMRERGENQRAADTLAARATRTTGTGGSESQYNVATNNQLAVFGSSVADAESPEQVKKVLAAAAKAIGGFTGPSKSTTGTAKNVVNQNRALQQLIEYARHSAQGRNIPEEQLIKVVKDATGIMPRVPVDEGLPAGSTSGSLSVSTTGAAPVPTLKRRGASAGGAADISGISGEEHAKNLKAITDKELVTFLSDKDRKLYEEMEERKKAYAAEDGTYRKLPSADFYYQNQNRDEEDAMIEAITAAKMGKKK